MMNEIECPGLPADWLNSWLASIGLLVLEPRLRLRWTPDATPIAVLSADNEPDTLSLTVQSWPQLDRLSAMPIARHIEGLRDMKRTVLLDVFRERAEFARGHTDSWSLSSSITDLFVDSPDVKASHADRTKHADLDPEAPRGTTLHDRLMKCFKEVRSPSDAIPATLGGHGTRTTANGLGFDASRISGLADSSDKMVDPVIEVLVFFGLRMLPMRGDGIEVRKSGTKTRFAARQRCWHLDTTQRPLGQRMAWPAWRQSLDYPGVDALLDQWSRLIEQSARGRRMSPAEISRLGVHAAWKTRRYIKRDNERTVGFASARVELDARRR